MGMESDEEDCPFIKVTVNFGTLGIKIVFLMQFESSTQTCEKK